MKDPYIQCYLSGRYDLYDGDVDLEKLIERAVSPGMVSIRTMAHSAAQKEIDGEMDAATKVAWLKDNLEEIRVMGGDTERAWRLYVQGRVDNLAHQLEADVIGMMEDMLDVEDEDAPEENPEGDDDDEDDDDADEDDDDGDDDGDGD